MPPLFSFKLPFVSVLVTLFTAVTKHPTSSSLNMGGFIVLCSSKSYSLEKCEHVMARACGQMLTIWKQRMNRKQNPAVSHTQGEDFKVRGGLVGKKGFIRMGCEGGRILSLKGSTTFTHSATR